MVDRLPTKSHLERLVNARAEATGVGHTRVRRWVSTMVLVGALARARSEDDAHRFVIKGGLAMELRLGTAARATADVDVTFFGDPVVLEQALGEAFAAPLSGFTFRTSRSTPVGRGAAVRIAVRLDYRGKPWATIDTEISTADPPADIEFVPAVELGHFGLSGPARVATLSTRFQVAQKLHAVSERFSEGSNARVRDIIDILLLRDLLPPLGEVRDACIEVFGERGMHAWPPVITTYDEWGLEYQRLCGLIDFGIVDLAEAVDEVHALIGSIDEAQREG